MEISNSPIIIKNILFINICGIFKTDRLYDRDVLLI